MSSTHVRQPETPPDNAVRQRLFRFFAQPDGSIGEILDLTNLAADDLGRWMTGHAQHGIAVRIEEALNLIDLIESGHTVSVGSAVQ